MICENCNINEATCFHINKNICGECWLEVIKKLRSVAREKGLENIERRRLKIMEEQKIQQSGEPEDILDVLSGEEIEELDAIEFGEPEVEEAESE